MSPSLLLTYVRRHFNAGGTASLILSGSAIKSDFVTPAAQMLCEKALI
jgi:hypothetical protein